MAYASQDDEYVCTLSEASLRKAKEELNENEKDRLGSVQALREWVNQQKWLKTPTDTAFLLRFLRVRKFSQLSARASLEKYWTERTKNREWFQADPTDPDILDIISTGFFLLPPGCDQEGRRLVIERPGVVDMQEMMDKYGLDKYMSALLMVMDVAIMDDNSQVNGYQFLHDGSKTNSDTALVYNISMFRKLVPIYQKAHPTRVKGLHLYHMNVLFDALVSIMKTMILEKLAKRMHIHGKSMVSVYKHVDKRLLPLEYLPDGYTGPSAGSIQDIIDYMKREIAKPEVIHHLKELNSGKYGVNLDLKAKADIPNESFRKMNIE